MEVSGGVQLVNLYLPEYVTENMTLT